MKKYLKRGLVLAILALAAVPAVAGAHSYYMPMNKGVHAIRHFANGVGDRLNSGFFAGTRGCWRAGPARVTCVIEFDFDSGATCTTPYTAHYVGGSNYTNYIAVSYNDRRAHCY